MISMATSKRVQFYLGFAGQPRSVPGRRELIAKLLQKGVSVQLCRTLEDIGQETVLGEFAGAIPAELQENAIDVSGKSDDEVVDRIASNPGGGEPTRRWKPWFPVIDFSRCTNCMQCLSFCLFDVYGVTKEGKIQVQNESNCKTDCPACSRVCPEVAIMFPKYKAGPINGDEINSEDLRREAMKVDISALLGGDIYSMLRDRSAKAKSRFSKERDDERALKERQRCLDKLKGTAGDFEIPAEVLASLPSADEIQFKAEQAKRKAAEALERQAQNSPTGHRTSQEQA